MIRHIVLLKFKSDVSQAQIDEVLSFAQRLPTAIPEIRALAAGKNFTPRDDTFSHAIVDDFQSVEDLNKYSAHPVHLELVSLLRPLIEKLNFVDFEY